MTLANPLAPSSKNDRVSKGENMREILPCPFCGSKPFLVERKCEKYKTNYGIGCSNIDCILFLPPDVRKRELHNYVMCYVHKHRMLDAWNRRVLPKVVHLSWL